MKHRTWKARLRNEITNSTIRLHNTTKKQESINRQTNQEVTQNRWTPSGNKPRPGWVAETEPKQKPIHKHMVFVTMGTGMGESVTTYDPYC